MTVGLKPHEKAMNEHVRQTIHRRVADIGNGGKASGSGGSKGNSEPREQGEKTPRDRAVEAKPAYGTSGMEGAIGKMADKLHPTKR